MHAGRHAAWHIANSASEWIDLTEALWKAIPKEKRSQDCEMKMTTYTTKKGVTKSKMMKRCENPTPYGMAVDIYNNLDSLDLNQFIANYVNMQIGDAVSSIGADKTVNQALGKPFGGGYAESHAREYASGGYDGKKDNDTRLPVPELNYDRATNSYSWSIPSLDNMDDD